MNLPATIAFAMAVSLPASALASETAPTQQGTQLEAAIAASILEARKCNVDVDTVDVTASRVGPTYRIEFIDRRKRGGGAEVVVESSSARIQSSQCLQ